MKWRILEMACSVIMASVAVAGEGSSGECLLDFTSPDEVKHPLLLSQPSQLDVRHVPGGGLHGACIVVSNKEKKTGYLSVRCVESCQESEGVLFSVWVKAARKPMPKTRCGLNLKREPSGAESAYLDLSSIPLMEDRWTLLSGWFYRKPKTGTLMDFKISIPVDTSLLMDDLRLTRSGVIQPSDHRNALQVKGADIMDGDTRFLLHGMNVYGCSDDERQSDTLHETSSVTEADYADIAAAGFNTVRMCLWHRVFRDNGGWEWLKIHCLWARRHGLRIILDMHSPPGGYQSNGYKGRFWKDPLLQQTLIDFWVQAAVTFRDDPVIAAFDIMNEPKPPTDKDWLSFASRALREVRTAGWNRPVIVESSMLVDGWSESSPKLDDLGVIYDVHFYMPWDFCSKGEPAYGQAGRGYSGAIIDAAFLREHLELDLLRFGRKHHVPVNSGEFGVSEKALAAGGQKWLADMTSLMNKNGVHRQYFCWCVYSDFAVEPGWFRQSPPKRRVDVLKILRDSHPETSGQQSAAHVREARGGPRAGAP